jgi:hypothetical protein
MKEKKTTPKKKAVLNDNSVVSSNSTQAVVTFAKGERVFSHETHGKEFETLAVQFAEKFNGVVQCS